MTTRRLFTAIFFLALFAMATREISDPDFWWHLRTGQFIVETQTIPHADIFSHTNAGQPWVTHEWFSEVFIYAIFALGSFPALIALFAGFIALAFALTYVRMPGKPYVAAFVLLLGALATAPTWGVRPQMFSMLLTSAFLLILERRRALWLLVPLMILWVNLHSGYALGIVILTVYLFDDLIIFFANKLANHPTTQPPKQLALIFVLTIFSVLLNPNGATMFVYPFETLTSRAMQAYIQEWFSPDFHLAEFQPFAILLIATLAATTFVGKRVSLAQTILLAGFTFAALRSARNIPMFALVAAPILAEQAWHGLGSRGWTRALEATRARPTRTMAILNWVVLGAIVVGVALRFATVAINQPEIERAKFPASAVEHLQKQKSPGALFNAYGWGGYLIWKLYPAQRVFIDGRADVYGDAFIENVFLKAYRGGADWREPLERYNVRVVLVEPDAPIAAQLARDETWKKTYEDKQAVVFEKK